jgi:hypothetical protein
MFLVKEKEEEKKQERERGSSYIQCNAMHVRLSRKRNVI